MTELKDGGAAFPCEGGPCSGLYSDPGMSLRDYFAAAALPAIIAATSANQHFPEMLEGDAHIRYAIARDAYDMADAMLCAKAKGVR